MMAPWLEHPYFFSGVAGHAALIGGFRGGVEAVVDVYNQQAGGFTVPQIAQINIGVGVELYTGLALDTRARVGADLVAAWGGKAKVELTVSANVGLGPFYAGIKGTPFAARDVSIVGFYMSLEVGAGMWAPLMVSGQLGIGSANFSSDVTRSAFGGDGATPVHLNTPRDVTQAIFRISPGLAAERLALPIGYTSALTQKLLTGILVQSILKSKAAHTSLSALCP